jgi:hypothetical protein
MEQPGVHGIYLSINSDFNSIRFIGLGLVYGMYTYEQQYLGRSWYYLCNNVSVISLNLWIHSASRECEGLKGILT